MVTYEGVHVRAAQNCKPQRPADNRFAYPSQRVTWPLVAAGAITSCDHDMITTNERRSHMDVINESEWPGYANCCSTAIQPLISGLNSQI
ncbi:type IV conjugative transfer system protein TraE [Anopheles sinensis]|uniref:Type IV conjugative transfer system protein TraE n=1 Tax=Anopheles sinensis TaxID=74873 RepID=A0A084VVL7_ANOSI|nr:type IV conjugative transfer system protein TraE [Anopheles sinensis]